VCLIVGLVQFIVAFCFTVKWLSRSAKTNRPISLSAWDSASIETPKAPRNETPSMSRGWDLERGYPPPQRTGGSGSAVRSPVGFGAEPRPKTNLGLMFSKCN